MGLLAKCAGDGGCLVRGMRLRHVKDVFFRREEDALLCTLQGFVPFHSFHQLKRCTETSRCVLKVQVRELAWPPMVRARSHD
jgi:hypothetical protein